MRSLSCMCLLHTIELLIMDLSHLCSRFSHYATTLGLVTGMITSHRMEVFCRPEGHSHLFERASLGI